MNGHRSTVNLGSFVVGELPAPLEYQYLDADGVALDLTGYGVARFQWGEHGTGGNFVNAVDRPAVISDALAGRVRYTWLGDEFDVTGPHAGLFFVGSALNQYASLLLTWDVCASVTTPP